jgi:pantetheine-phosphate adenylyltransferase
VKAIYPGTFDPVTYGHLDLIDRGLEIFRELVVAVARNEPKAPLFSAEERLAMVRESAGDRPGLSVVIFDTLLINFAARKGAQVILRGLRAVSDFEYELQIALTNRELVPDIETVFMMPSKKYIYLSSRIVREIAAYGGPVEEFVPPPVQRRLQARFAPQGGPGTC